MKVHRGAADLLAARAQHEGRPTTVTFQVTDRCNYECVHCYQEHKDHRHEAPADAELSLAEIDRILDELADAGVLFLTLMGGEFFMRRDADEILAAAHAKGFAIKLLTTGHHVTDARADFLATLRPLQVDMSLYSGRSKHHEAVTRSPGSWARTVAAARRLLARRVPVLLKAPVMEVNAAEVESLGELARELGAEWTYDAKITAMETGDDAPVALRMSASTLEAFYRGPMADYLERTYAGPDAVTSRAELRPLSHTPCRAGQQSLSIAPNGDVWPCNALPLPSGNLRRQSFADVWWGSKELAMVRDLRWAQLAECNVCELRPYCQRCHGMALVEQGELHGPSLEACRHAVTVREALRAKGLVADDDTAMPPTWDRVDRDGQHHLAADGKRRARGLRVLP
ncbi:MAG TPA: radical SAM protein [Kofleriaceae bacterium]|nr:radical SAM protein [Kofleriaceae bacterium]